MSADLQHLFEQIKKQGQLQLPTTKITPGNTDNTVEQYLCQGKHYIVTRDREGNVLDINDQQPLAACRREHFPPKAIWDKMGGQ